MLYKGKNYIIFSFQKFWSNIKSIFIRAYTDNIGRIFVHVKSLICQLWSDNDFLHISFIHNFFVLIKEILVGAALAFGIKKNHFEMMRCISISIFIV